MQAIANVTGWLRQSVYRLRDDPACAERFLSTWVADSSRAKAWVKPPDHREPAPEAIAKVVAALTHVQARAAAAGKFAGLFCFSCADPRTMGQRGFALTGITTDLLRRGGAARWEVLDAARGA